MREDGFWHFQCPECGIGDAELGRLAADQELYCEICAEERRVSIHLRRWLPELDRASSRAGLAA